MTVILPQFAHDIELPGCMLVAGDTEFPLTGVAVKGHVDGHGVVWIITQTFSNPLTEPAEAVYKFPLPYNGAVNGMKMTVANRIIEAVIKERGEARTEYKEAKALGHTAALVEQERAEIFTTHVGNIHPGEAVSVVITIHCIVAVDGDEATLRFPMMVKERYIPASQPDTHSITTTRVSGPITVDTDVTITFEEQVRNLVCDTVPTAKIAGQTVTITDSAAMKTDIVLRWDATPEVCTAKWTPDSPDSDEGTVEVTIRTEGKSMTMAKKRAVSILLDRSGSMSRHYLEWARRIVESIIATLDNDDLVHVLTFDSVIEAFEATAHGFTPADRAACAAILRELKTVNARGGTELVQALDAVGAALGTLQSNEHERVVVILTDGAYGDEAEAMRYRNEQLAGARVITVAIGENANGFLDALAADGTCIFVEADHGVATAAQKVVSRISTPAHRHARLVADGLHDQAPHLAPDIYPRLVVRLTGRMKWPATGATIEVMCDDGTVAIVPIAVSRDSSITTRWASLRIKALDADLKSERDTAKVTELEKAITALSIAYSVLSNYTAWLAVDRSRSTDSVVVRTLVQPDYELNDWSDDASAGMSGGIFHAHAVQSHDLKWSSMSRRYTSVAWGMSRTSSPSMDSIYEADEDPFDLKNRLSAWQAELDYPIRVHVVLTIKMLLDEATITSEQFVKVRARVLFAISHLSATRKAQKFAKSIVKRLERCESALAKGKESRAREHLVAIVSLFEKASAEVMTTARDFMVPDDTRSQTTDLKGSTQ